MNTDALSIVCSHIGRASGQRHTECGVLCLLSLNGTFYTVVGHFTKSWNTLHCHGQHYTVMVHITPSWSTLHCHGPHYTVLGHITLSYANLHRPRPIYTLMGHFTVLVNFTSPWVTLHRPALIRLRKCQHVTYEQHVSRRTGIMPTFISS